MDREITARLRWVRMYHEVYDCVIGIALTNGAAALPQLLQQSL